MHYSRVLLGMIGEENLTEQHQLGLPFQDLLT